MSTYQSNITLAQAADKLRAATNILLVTHAKPDGDAYGSVVALAAALAAMGKHVEPWLMPPIPESLRVLDGYPMCKSFTPGSEIGPTDLTVIVDTGAWAQLWPMKAVLEPRLANTLILDHHLSGDVQAAYKYIEGQAAACCEVIAQLLELLNQGRPAERSLFSPVVCEALFVGLASDTGWFRFSNTRPMTHEWAARLLTMGVHHAEIYRKLEQTERPEKLALMIRALDSMKLLFGGRAAIMVLRAGDFQDTGALLEETERFVDIPQIVGSVELVVLATETPDKNGTGNNGNGGPATIQNDDKPVQPPVIRLSFRSKPGPRAVDVATLAGQFHGGGHARASGAKVQAPLEQVLEDVERAVLSALDRRR